MMVRAQSPRLLSFLNLVETTIQNEEPDVVCKSRTVNYHKGVACLVLSDGNTIHLQCFHLADGKICLKASVLWQIGGVPGEYSIYPTDNFDWLTAAYNVMNVWKAGPIAAAAAASS
ncbi:MAG: hypothetical protein KBG39_04350 [Opitutaceae bacterium]|nr:hypothetical protein [Opitutaceae bacterium]HOD46397.1 hypothetical protein [Opitutaceae bacterium]HOG92621.1 hypothetical protein [Opitutaceae bacterium]HOY53881.1 hypothetical protein [Opitutaceae bacterium]